MFDEWDPAAQEMNLVYAGKKNGNWDFVFTGFPVSTKEAINCKSLEMSGTHFSPWQQYLFLQELFGFRNGIFRITIINKSNP
jgi:hypothetical protein